MDKKISVNLRRLLAEKKMTQDRLAALSKVSKSTISNYVNGKPDITPRPENLKMICEALGVSEDELYAEIEDEASLDSAANLAQAQARIQELEREHKEDKEAMIEMSHQIELLRTALETNNAQHESNTKDLRKVRNALAIALVITVILLVAVAFYAGFAFLAFDVMDPTRGLYRG